MSWREGAVAHTWIGLIAGTGLIAKTKHALPHSLKGIIHRHQFVVVVGI